MKILHFKTHAQLKNVLGQELINDDNVAIQELVKNSYDAGSKPVDIIFKNLKLNKDAELNNSNRDKLIAESSKIFVIDQGCGMTLKDINDKWLNIAYSAKKNEKSKDERIFAGAKGVGRFSCDRLGEFLDLYTKTVNDDKIIHLRINWNEFDEKSNVNDLIQNVDVYLDEPLTTKELGKKLGDTILKSGTILEISKLRTNWIEEEGKRYFYEKIVSLKKALQKLTNPNQNIEKEGFKIRVKILDLSKQDYDLTKESDKEEYDYLKKELVENQIFTQLNFRTTYIESVLNKEYITTTLKYQDKIIFELQQKNVYDALKKVNIKIKLHFLNQYSKAYFKRYTGIRSVNFGSIFLFMNGFRIASYGDYGNDWLNIEVRKGQGRARFLGTRDLVGWFELNDNEGIFKIISNREGLVKNKAYRQLVGDTVKNFIGSYFYSIFRKLELFVVEGLDWDRISKTKTEDNIEEDEKFEIKSFMTDFEAQISSNKWKYDPSKEKYAESTHEKNMRILRQIFRIITIGTKKKDIISLYLNEEVLSELAEENIDFAKSIIGNFDGFDKISLATKTSKGISHIKKIFAKMEARQKRTEEEKRKAEEKAEKAEEKATKEENKRKEAEKKAEEADKHRKSAETENIFLKSTNLQDKEQITSLFHHIGIHSDTIKSHAGRVLKNLIEVKGIPESTIQKIESIAKLTQIINTISKVGFKGGITEEMESEKQDVIQFIGEFIKNICIPYYININIEIDNTIKRKYIREFAPFELTYVIDNFISNSKKAHATKMLFKLYEQEDNAIIEIVDNGNGLNPKIDKIEDIFNRTVSTTRGGAGLGLFDARKILSKIKCKISAEKIEKGFKLKIVIPHEN